MLQYHSNNLCWTGAPLDPALCLNDCGERTIRYPTTTSSVTVDENPLRALPRSTGDGLSGYGSALPGLHDKPMEESTRCPISERIHSHRKGSETTG